MVDRPRPAGKLGLELRTDVGAAEQRIIAEELSALAGAGAGAGSAGGLGINVHGAASAVVYDVGGVLRLQRTEGDDEGEGGGGER